MCICTCNCASFCICASFTSAICLSNVHCKINQLIRFQRETTCFVNISVSFEILQFNTAPAADDANFLLDF